MTRQHNFQVKAAGLKRLAAICIQQFLSSQTENKLNDHRLIVQVVSNNKTTCWLFKSCQERGNGTHTHTHTHTRHGTQHDHIASAHGDTIMCIPSFIRRPAPRRAAYATTQHAIAAKKSRAAAGARHSLIFGCTLRKALDTACVWAWAWAWARACAVKPGLRLVFAWAWARACGAFMQCSRGARKVLALA